MNRTFTHTQRGETIKFEEGEEYYIADWFTYETANTRSLFPVVIKAICIEEDYEEEGVEFYLKTVEHLIPSRLPLGQYEHPNGISVSDWSTYFFKTKEDAYNSLYERWKEDPAIFFGNIFGEV